MALKYQNGLSGKTLPVYGKKYSNSTSSSGLKTCCVTGAGEAALIRNALALQERRTVTARIKRAKIDVDKTTAIFLIIEQLQWYFITQIWSRLANLYSFFNADILLSLW
jgi:hypothetical protein